MTVRVNDCCSGCGSCVTTCPAGAITPLARGLAVTDGLCNDCLSCVEVCPADAIESFDAASLAVST
ncbi:MAG: indolepyruvate ferredoxin oxidoreductase subunit alpha [Acidimicrobiales bacterium]